MRSYSLVKGPYSSPPPVCSPLFPPDCLPGIRSWREHGTAGLLFSECQPKGYSRYDGHPVDALLMQVEGRGSAPRPAPCSPPLLRSISRAVVRGTFRSTHF